MTAAINNHCGVFAKGEREKFIFLFPIIDMITYKISMCIKPVNLKDKEAFNRLALHPLQSWEWGDFRKMSGLEIIRLGKYTNNKLTETAQITIHPIPFVKKTIGYFPKGRLPSYEMLQELVIIGKEHNCIFIKLEPNITINNLSKFLIHKSPHPLFTKYTLQLDLTKSEEELLKNMHPKTRYNIKVAQKHGVVIAEDSSEEAFANYLRLTFETTKRQKFYAHDEKYHRLMWETLKKSGIAHLFTATYLYEGRKHILASWVVFLFNGVLYYPYGASSERFRNTMASTLLMWEIIRFGQKRGAKIFDMWGALGPDPNPADPWFGFHRFKMGFSPKPVEFIGSYDLVIDPALYRFYNLGHRMRNLFLRIKRNLS